MVHLFRVNKNGKSYWRLGPQENPLNAQSIAQHVEGKEATITYVASNPDLDGTEDDALWEWFRKVKEEYNES